MTTARAKERKKKFAAQLPASSVVWAASTESIQFDQHYCNDVNIINTLLSATTFMSILYQLLNVTNSTTSYHVEGWRAQMPVSLLNGGYTVVR